MATRTQMQTIALGPFTAAVNGTNQALNRSLDACSFVLRGTFVGTVVFEGSDDGTNYSTLKDINGTAVSLTAPGIVTLCGSVPNARARCSAYTSGTAVAVLIIPPQV